MTSTVTDRESLLAAVLAAPGDDLPRLIYADWLEENGQELAASNIRGQITHGWTWESSHPFRPMLDFRPGLLCKWRRGFIAELRGPLAALLEHGPEIVRSHPVERVEVTDADISKITPSAPYSRFRIWNSVGVNFGNDVGYALIGYYRSRESALDALNAAVLAEIRRRAAAAKAGK